MNRKAVEAFVRLLRQSPASDVVFNPWYHVDPDFDASAAAPQQRRRQLEAYLLERLPLATHLLVAEAPGFRGCKFTGIPMTCERQIGTRTSCEKRLPKPVDRQQGMLEPTASIVAKLLRTQGVDPRRVVLWNTFAWHPHRRGDRLTNRTPTPAEVSHGLPVLKAMFELFPRCQIVAIGKTAQRTMEELFSAAIPSVRHPANGGATLFATQMATLLKP